MLNYASVMMDLAYLREPKQIISKSLLMFKLVMLLAGGTTTSQVPIFYSFINLHE